MDALSQYHWNVNFISEIEKRPMIWNQSLKSRHLQKLQWEELSELYKKSVDSLKRKYSKLKVKFCHQLSMIPQTNSHYDIDPQSFESEWPLYRQMLFLINATPFQKMKKRKSTSIEQNSVTKRRREQYNYDNVPEIGHASDKFENLQINEELPTKIEVKPDIFPNPPVLAEDGVYHFLMSLYECMSELDPIRKINVQARIYSLLSQEVAESAKN